MRSSSSGSPMCQVMNELYQAQATLNSIIEKSPVKSIVSEAKVKLADLEKELSLEKQFLDNE